MTNEEIFRKNFNEMMPGVKFKQMTYEQFRQEYRTLHRVIIKSMDEVKTKKP